MQAIKKTHIIGPEKNASQPDGQRERWTAKKDWFYKTPSAKMAVSSCFSEICKYNFLKSFGLIVSKTSKTMILSKFTSDNFHIISMSQIHCYTHLFLYVIAKGFVITKSSVVEIQNLNVNPRSQPVKSNSEQYQLLFKYTSSKIQYQKFKKKRKRTFWGSFLPKGNSS